MDKAEYQVKLDQLKALVAEQDYDGALDVVKGVDWRRVKNIRTLCMVADVYEANDMLEDSKRILLLALKRASIGKTILSRLVELCLMMNDTEGASEYYQEFIKAAPRDAARYLLQYKILKANQSSLDEQIEALHDYKECEYTERWAYELARLYDKAGRTEECIEECDDIILWFSEGVYVVRAMELKMKHTQLTPSQQDKYDHRFETMPELQEKEEPKFPRKKKKTETVIEEQPESASEKLQDEAPEVNEQPETQKPKVKEEFTNTIDLQSRLSQGLKKVIGGMIHDDEDEPEDDEQESVEEIFANVESDRYAPKLEPEKPAESGIRRDAVVTKPETMKKEEEAVTGDTFDFSAMFEAQADAFAEGREPDQPAKTASEIPDIPDIPEETAAPEELQEDDFDLSKILESEVADILNEKKEAAKQEEKAVPEIREEASAVLEAEEPKQPEEELSFDFDLEKQIVETAEAEVAAGRAEEEQPEKEIPEIIENITPAEKLAPELEFDLEEQILKASRMAENGENKAEEPEELFTEAAPAKTLDLQKEISEALTGKVDEETSGAALWPDQEMPAEKADELEKNNDGEFDLQALLAAEVSDMIANPVQLEPPVEEKEPEKKEEEDLVSRLEQEADRTIEHQELEKETPQDKRLRIMRAAPANRMTEEQKRVFTYFAKVPGMDTQILEALNKAYNGAVSKTSRHGNIAIMGRKGTGKTRLSEGLIKALCKEFEMSAAKFARIHARDLNEKDVAQVVSKLSGGFLVIEKASYMTDETIMKLNQAMEFRTDSMILIIEDEKEDMKNMLEAHPEFAEKFDAVIKIPVFTNDELVTFARTYAGECGYKMDEMGILALYTIIGANQSVDEPVSIAKVKEMVDAAIAKAGKGGRKIGRKLSGRQVDRMNRIILYEKDFEL